MRSINISWLQSEIVTQGMTYLYNAKNTIHRAADDPRL